MYVGSDGKPVRFETPQINTVEEAIEFLFTVLMGIREDFLMWMPRDSRVNYSAVERILEDVADLRKKAGGRRKSLRRLRRTMKRVVPLLAEEVEAQIHRAPWAADPLERTMVNIGGLYIVFNIIAQGVSAREIDLSGILVRRKALEKNAVQEWIEEGRREAKARWAVADAAARQARQFV